MSDLKPCPKCNGTGLVQIAPNVRGLKRCPCCGKDINVDTDNWEEVAVKMEEK